MIHERNTTTVALTVDTLRFIFFFLILKSWNLLPEHTPAEAPHFFDGPYFEIMFLSGLIYIY